jgi:hypothetical protein
VPLFKIGATIPVTQYGNLTPEIEVEAETFEAAQAIVLPQIETIWARYCEPGRELRSNGQRIKAFIGDEIDYDELTHTYSWQGQRYLSGSEYARQFEKPFDVNTVSLALSKKFNVAQSDVKQMWALKSEVSTGFGTAIHAAIELYERYRPLCEAMEKLTHLHDHPIIKKAVEGFYALQSEHPAEPEAVVVDHTHKHAGRIDRLVILGPQRCRLQDIKTNGSPEKVAKSLPAYWKQLEFYQRIMEAHGWAVEGLDIFHWDGNWKRYINKKETE